MSPGINISFSFFMKLFFHRHRRLRVSGADAVRETEEEFLKPPRQGIPYFWKQRPLALRQWCSRSIPMPSAYRTVRLSIRSYHEIIHVIVPRMCGLGFPFSGCSCDCLTRQYDPAAYSAIHI